MLIPISDVMYYCYLHIPKSFCDIHLHLDFKCAETTDVTIAKDTPVDFIIE